MTYSYVATPFRAFPGSRDDACEEACRAAGVFVRAGLPIFCPIAHSYNISCLANLDPDDDLWPAQNEPFLLGAAALVIVKMPGYDKSEGIEHERKTAQAHGIPIFYADMGHVPHALLDYLAGLKSKPTPVSKVPQTAAEFAASAIALVDGERHVEYGAREKNFATIAGMWSAYLGRPIDEVDVAFMMQQLKMARHKNGNFAVDSHVDNIGYATIAAEIATKKAAQR